MSSAFNSGNGSDNGAGNGAANGAAPFTVSTVRAEEIFTEAGVESPGEGIAPENEPAAGTPAAGPGTPFSQSTVDEAQRIVARYPQSRSALLPMLHLVQSVEGNVSQAGVRFCAEQLGLSTAEVSAVVTFYTMYKREPCGQHLVSVCTNTLCAVLGGDTIYQRLTEHLGQPGKPLGHEETVGTPGESGSITIEHAECLAACDLAPVLQVNYEYYDNQTVEKATELVDALRRGEKPAPTRGPALTDFRTVERELAGFFDTPSLVETTAGPSAATETLRGAQIAADRGWTAPAMPDDAPLPEAEKK